MMLDFLPHACMMIRMAVYRLYRRHRTKRQASVRNRASVLDFNMTSAGHVVMLQWHHHVA